MPFRIDLHVHSRDSGDNNADPEESVIQAIDRRLQGIAFTEHYSFGASEGALRLAEKYRDRIVIIRGVEYSTPDGHCLIFGVDTDRLPLKDLTVQEIVTVVTGEGGAVIPSHPYRSVNSLGDRVKRLRGIAAVEGYNGCNMALFNDRAVETARMLSLPYTGGSDAHESRDVGACYTEFDALVTPENLVGLLRAGRYRGVDTRKISKGFWSGFPS
ncbi:MAG: PHP domain-containing protein [Nitrospiraceae bacterium]|nr:PHP domain-containing protein [Nitrospiraceae bacterium]